MHGHIAIELRNVTKRFPGVVANDNVSLAFKRAEIHALLGENGAGKSTLISMLAGMVKPDAGEILIDDHRVNILSPRQALDHGIGTVYQHTLLIPSLSVLENLMLGLRWWRRYDRAATLKRFGELKTVLSANIDPDADVGRLSLGEQQQVEIMRALWHGERALILDEPTSMLTPQGAQELFEVVGRIRQRGVAVIFITHKLREAYALADHISVLRLGKVVGALSGDQLRTMAETEVDDRIVAMMFGNDRGQNNQDKDVKAELIGAPNMPGHAFFQTRHDGNAQVVLSNARTHAARGECPLRGASLEVWAGQKLGIAGVDGNGQKHLAEVLAGQRALADGCLEIDGVDVSAGDVRARHAVGVRYITDERLGEGTAGSHSVATNLLLKSIGQRPYWGFGGVTRWGRINCEARDTIIRHDIRTPSEKMPIATLSGGNIQKTLLARELSPGARLIVFNKPTYGLDLQNTRLARQRIREGAGSANAAIIVISNELDELLQTCDRIAVMTNGQVRGVVDNRPGAEAEVGRLMIGADASGESAV